MSTSPKTNTTTSAITKTLLIGLIALSSATTHAQGFLPPVSYPITWTPSSIIAADLNHDTYCDIITPNQTSNSITIMLANPNGTLQPPTDYPIGNLSLGATITDIDEDGNPDIIAATSANITILAGDGTGSFLIHSIITFPGMNNLYAITTGYFNQDSHPDIAATKHIGGPMYVLLNNGSGLFPTQVPYPIPAGPAHARDILCTNIDPDPFPDLLCCSQTDGSLPSVATCFKGNGDGTFQTGIPATLTGNPSNIITGHFTNLPTTETLAISTSPPGLSRILFNTTPPTITAAVYNGTPGYDICTADFNSDSYTDLAIGGLTEVITKINTPSNPGVFQNPSYPTTPASLQFIDTGDFNGDGKPDIAAASYTTFEINILLNNYPTTSNIPNWTLY